MASVLTMILILASFTLLEPTVSRSAVDQFLVTQSITEEISFIASTTDVSMEGSINGLTGGYASGTTYAVVRTNDPDGYSMTLGFSSTTAMVANNYASNQGYVNNYSMTATTVPDYEWTSDGTAAEFGYTVNASNTADIASYFKDNGTNCNQSSGGYTANRCWMSPTTTAAADTIVNRTSAASSGATTSIYFKIEVPSNPTPGLPSDTYTATATLTATNNP